jgi:cytochrome c5
MRVIVTSLALVLSAGAVLAQTGSMTTSPAATAPSTAAPANPGPAVAGKAARTGKSAVDDSIAECMGLWDAGTHMSKQEWSSTCKRIQTRLENLKIENLDVMGAGVRKKAGAGKQGSIDLPNRTN